MGKESSSARKARGKRAKRRYENDVKINKTKKDVGILGVFH